MISPREFRDLYAPGVGVPTIRELFHREKFPSVKIGDRWYSTREASERYLTHLNQELLMGGGEQDEA
jgi:hypothetical protein